MTTAWPSPPDPDKSPKYPFSQWLDGREWTLVRGRDFWGPVANLRVSVQRSANSRRLRVVIDTSAGSAVRVKALGPTSREGDAPDADQILAMRIKGYTYRRIAERLGCSVEQVKLTVDQALNTTPHGPTDA